MLCFKSVPSGLKRGPSPAACQLIFDGLLKESFLLLYGIEVICSAS